MRNMAIVIYRPFWVQAVQRIALLPQQEAVTPPVLPIQKMKLQNMFAAWALKVSLAVYMNG